MKFYDALHEEQTVTEVAKKFGISRGSVYNFKEGMQFTHLKMDEVGIPVLGSKREQDLPAL